MGTLEMIDIGVSILANLTVVAALLIAWWSYQAQQNQAKRNAALDIVTQFNSSELLAAQRRFSLEMQRLPLVNLGGEVLPRNTMATLMDQLVSTADNSEILIQDIITIVSHLDDAAICIETKTCDPQVLSAHLEKIAIRYACTLLPYVGKMNDEMLLESLGRPLYNFSKYESNC